MREVFFHVMLFVFLFVLPACVSMGGSTSGSRPKGVPQAATGQPNQKESPTPKDLVIAQGRIDVERIFAQQLPAGTDSQQESGQVAFQVRGDPADSSIPRYVSGEGTMKWTEEVRTANCSWNASATGTIKISGRLIGRPFCRLQVKITEQWNAMNYTWQQCDFTLGPLGSKPSISYDADFPLKSNAHLRGLETESGAWDQKDWYLRRLVLDPSTGCDPGSTLKHEPSLWNALGVMAPSAIPGSRKSPKGPHLTATVSQTVTVPSSAPMRLRSSALRTLGGMRTTADLAGSLAIARWDASAFSAYIAPGACWPLFLPLILK